MSSQPGTDLPALPALPQTGDEAQAIETAVRTAVLSIMKVFLDLSDNRAQRYQLKLAEMERENFQLKLKLKAAELQLHAGQHSTCSGESYQISADLTFTPETSLSLSSVTDNKEEEQTRAEEASEAVASSQSEEPRLEASDLKLFKEEPNYEDTFWIKNEVAEEGGVEEAVAFCGYSVLTDDFSGDPHVQQQQQQIIPVQRCGACSSLNHTIREEDAPTASSLQRKKLASTERVRQYRARIRADPEKYHMLKEKDRIRYLSRKKTIADLPEPMKNLKRKAWREASKRHRARKLSLIHNTTNICDQHV